MPFIAWPQHTEDIINDIINTIGRNVEFVQVTLSGCTFSGCFLDPITNTSTNSFCPVCSGQYWIPIYSGVTISAHVTWKPSDTMEWEFGGQIFTGDCLVKIIYSDNNLNTVNNTKYIVVDNKQVTIKKKTLLGVPTINRILMETKEKEK